MKSALIGYTGFVGSNILKQANFDDLYNSKNIDNIAGKKYDLLVSAGTRAERWKANLEPDRDWEEIEKLLRNLEKVKVGHLVLISTVDVYSNPNGCNEDVPIDMSLFTQAYGLNRYKMEVYIKKLFSKVTIIRCPQLYGENLKKNFVFDLIFDNALDFTHKDSQQQWYNLKNIWKDITNAISNSISLVNFAVEPIKAFELAKYARNIEFENITKNPPLVYNFLTKYGSVYGSSDEYIYHKQEILDDLKDFIIQERNKIGK